MKKNNKKAEIAWETIAYIIFVLIFIGLLFIFVSRTKGNARVYEELYSKSIALIIESARPETEFELDVSKLVEIKNKNNFQEEIIKFDDDEKTVKVILTKGKGYVYPYFNNVEIVDVSIKNDKLFFKVK